MVAVVTDGLHRAIVIDERGQPCVEVVDATSSADDEVDVDVSEFAVGTRTMSAADRAALADLESRYCGGSAACGGASTGAPKP